MLQSHLSFFVYLPISAAHQHAIYDIIGRSVEPCSDKMRCVVVQLEADRELSGSQVYDWMMSTYNQEKLNKIFDVIRTLVNMRPGDTLRMIYTQQVARKFKELKDLLAMTEGNLTDLWQLMLWQQGLPLIPTVQAKLKKAGNELVEKKLNLEEWYNTVAKILQTHYEASKSAPPQVGQAFSLSPAGGCPCCGSHETAVQDAADMAASSINISNMSSDEIDEADAAVAKRFGVDAVQRCYACGHTGHISLNCPHGCCHCKAMPNKGTGHIQHKYDCPDARQGGKVAAARAGVRAQPGAGLANRARTPTPMRLQQRSQSPSPAVC